MNQLLYFIRRNLRLFCGNRLNILLSFASVLIVIGIYMLFLRDFLLDTVTRAGVESTFVKEFTDRFMLAGLLIVVNTTTCFGILQLSVADTETGIRRDYLVAPVSHFSLTIGYWVTACAARHKPLPNSRNRSVFLYDKCRHPPMPLPEAEKYGHIFHPGKPLWHSNRLSRRSLSALFLLSQLAARHAFLLSANAGGQRAAAALYRAFKNPARAASRCGSSAGAFAVLCHRAPATWLLCGHAAPIWADGVPLFAAHALPLGWRARK